MKINVRIHCKGQHFSLVSYFEGALKCYLVIVTNYTASLRIYVLVEQDQQFLVLLNERRSIKIETF